MLVLQLTTAAAFWGQLARVSGGARNRSGYCPYRRQQAQPTDSRATLIDLTTTFVRQKSELKHGTIKNRLTLRSRQIAVLYSVNCCASHTGINLIPPMSSDRNDLGFKAMRKLSTPWTVSVLVRSSSFTHLTNSRYEPHLAPSVLIFSSFLTRTSFWRHKVCSIYDSLTLTPHVRDTVPSASSALSTCS